LALPQGSEDQVRRGWRVYARWNLRGHLSARKLLGTEQCQGDRTGGSIRVRKTEKRSRGATLEE
jgi:hypothetical protein